MPEPVMSSWADEIEDNDSTVLPPPSEKVKGDIKTITEFAFNEVTAGGKLQSHLFFLDLNCIRKTIRSEN
jgi:hypothetical protein